jgi:hypothetical protein
MVNKLIILGRFNLIELEPLEYNRIKNWKRDVV